MRAFGAGKWRGMLAVVGLVLLVFVSFQAYELGACSRGERSALSEIPQLTGEQQEPGHINDGSCVVSYDTDVAPEEAVAHYRQHFEAKGWRIVRDEPNRYEASYWDWDISAEKGSYRYDVSVVMAGVIDGASDVTLYVKR